MRADSRRALVAALLWDKPTLVSLETDGARAFIYALSREMAVEVTADDEWEAEDALTIAAAGLLHSLRGRTQDAIIMFHLLTTRGGLASLLGYNLLAWLTDEGEAALTEAARIVKRQRDDILRARLLCKLAAIALDKGKRDLAWGFLVSAAEAASSKTYLGLQVRLVMMNEFGAFDAIDEIKAARERDDLVDQPWISRAAEEAGRQALVDYVGALGRRTRGFIFRFGATVVDKIVAAEMQATWSGALWLRARLRLQLAATLLSGGAQTPQQWSYACGMWVLGHGNDPGSVIDLAERHFDEASADTLVNEHLRYFGAGVWELRTSWEVIGAAWDLVSDATAERLALSLILPTAADPLGERAYQVLAALALRASESWLTRFDALSDEELVRLGTGTAPDVIERLPTRAANRLLELFMRKRVEPEDERSHVVIAALLSRADTPSVEFRDIGKVSPAAVAEIANRYPELVSDQVTVSAMVALQRRVREELTAAESGKWSVGGGRSSRRSLGALLPRVPPSRSRDSALATLTSVVVSERAPIDMRVEAALGLWPVADTHAIPERLISRLRATKTASRMWQLQGGTPEGVLRAAILGVVAPWGLTEVDMEALLTLSRDPDALTRRTAVAAVAFQNEGSFDENIVLAGLYDPNEDVVIAAVSAVRERAERGSSTRLPGLSDRLRTLFLTSGRDVRARIVSTIKAIPALQRADPRLAEVLARGLEDRSWVVRDVTRREEGPP